MSRHASMWRTCFSQPPRTAGCQSVDASAHRRYARYGWLVGLSACLSAVLLLPSRTALAETISLSATPEAVQELTSQITYRASGENASFAAVYVNAPGVACAPNPEADVGTGIVVPELSPLPSTVGMLEGSANYTPSLNGSYTICGWLIRYDAMAANGRGPVTASSSTQFVVRAPNIRLALSLPRPAQAGRPFVLDVHATSEVTREIVLERAPSHGHRCPVNWAASRTEHLIDIEIDGGPRVQHVDVGPLPAGRYVFCAWADPPADNGLDPQASATLDMIVSRSRHQRARHQHPTRPTSSRCPEFSTCQQGGGPFSP